MTDILYFSFQWNSDAFCYTVPWTFIVVQSVLKKLETMSQTALSDVCLDGKDHGHCGLLLKLMSHTVCCCSKCSLYFPKCVLICCWKQSLINALFIVFWVMLPRNFLCLSALQRLLRECSETNALILTGKLTTNQSQARRTEVNMRKTTEVDSAHNSKYCNVSCIL